MLHSSTCAAPRSAGASRLFAAPLWAWLLAALCLGLAFAGPSRAQTQKPAPPPQQAPAPVVAPRAVLPDLKPDIGDRLGKARAILDKTTQTLKRDGVDDSTLQALRAQLEPAIAEAQSAVDELQPHLDALKARIDQLGPRPDDKAAAPETETVAAERERQQKMLAEADEQTKQGRLLLVQLQQTDASIVQMRRQIFVRDLFQRTRSILSPQLWGQAASEAPGDFADVTGLLSDLLANAGANLTQWRAPVFGLLTLLIALFNIPALRVVRHILSRERQGDAVDELQRLLGAAWVAIVVAILPIATILLFFWLCDGFDLIGARLAPLRTQIVYSVARVSLSAGLARALFAPGRPNWRLIDVEDASASRLTRLALLMATLVSITKLVDSLNEIVGASVPVIAVTLGAGAIVSAAAILTTLVAVGPVEDEETRVRPVKRWLSIARVLAMTVALFILAAAAVGYIRFANFMVDQVVYTAAAATSLRILAPLASMFMEATFQPSTRIGRFLSANLGLSRDGVLQIGVMLGGLARLMAYFLAFAIVATPFGVASSDYEVSLARIFNGFTIGDIAFSPRVLFGALFLFGAVLLVSRSLQSWLGERFLPVTGIDDGLRNAIKTSVGYVGVILAIVLALAHIGLGLDKLTIVAGALSVGIGFGLQSIVSNFVSGLIVLWEGSVRVGDWIVVGADQGHVRRINVRSTEIETFDRATMIIPNSNLITGSVKNWVRSDRVGRVTISVSINTSADPDVVRELMIGAAREEERVARIPAPNVLFTSMDPSALKLDLVCFVDDVETSVRVKSDLNFAIFRAFRAAGVELASPTDIRVIRAEPPATEAIS